MGGGRGGEVEAKVSDVLHLRLALGRSDIRMFVSVDNVRMLLFRLHVHVKLTKMLRRHILKL